MNCPRMVTPLPLSEPIGLFRWGFLNVIVYAENPQSIQELKTADEEQARSIVAFMHENVLETFKKQIAACLQNRGRHMEHIV